MTDDRRSAAPGTSAATSATSAASVAPVGPGPLPASVHGAARRARIGARRRWPLFAGLAVAVIVADQIAKAIVTASLAPGQSTDIVGDLVRIVFGQNNGALFGLFKDNATMFGIVSLLVIGLIVAYHARSAPSLYLTVTLGLLLGGAVGNMVDRLRLGYVVDFVDIGVGPTRFYTFNVADSAISLAILLLFLAAVRPALVDGMAQAAPSSPSMPAAGPAGHAPDSAAPDDDWGDGLEADERPRTGAATDRGGSTP